MVWGFCFVSCQWEFWLMYIILYFKNIKCYNIVAFINEIIVRSTCYLVQKHSWKHLNICVKISLHQSLTIWAEIFHIFFFQFYYNVKPRYLKRLAKNLILVFKFNARCRAHNFLQSKQGSCPSFCPWPMPLKILLWEKATDPYNSCDKEGTSIKISWPSVRWGSSLRPWYHTTCDSIKALTIHTARPSHHPISCSHVS